MDVLEIMLRPTIGSVWLAFLVGLIVGRFWKPEWAFLGFWAFRLSAAPPSPSPAPASASAPLQNGSFGTTEMPPSAGNHASSSSHTQREAHLAITEEDLDHLRKLVERKDGGPLWKQMMDRSTPDMSYQAWQRDSATGPPQYCSRTVYEDATPEMVRDFFWDDEFRLKWDDMLLHATTIDECPTTGTMAVHWIRKFPFFCSDREYTIGRRIWESGRTYYCVTKGVPCPSIPRRQKPKRVDLYYSSWFIQAVASKKGDGQMTACEVVLFHHEDMGLPWEIAKLGVRRGMWGAVKKIEAGFRAYQIDRARGSPISHSASMAQITTTVDPNRLISMEPNEDIPEATSVIISEKTPNKNVRKLVIIGGIAFLACSLDRGLFSKTLIFGTARRFSNKGRRK